VKVSGVWFGGRVLSHVTVRRLNHGPSAEDVTPESLTATGNFANLPSAQLGTHPFSRSVPCPVAPDVVQAAQDSPSIRMPASAHASTIDDGSVLSGNGSAAAQLATTPTPAAAADEPGAAGVGGAVVGGAVVGGAVVDAGFAGAGELAAGACEAVAVVGGALADGAGEEAWPVGEVVAAGAELAAAELPRFGVHPATAMPAAAQRASLLSVWFTSLETDYARDGCNGSIR
jgi:hypothetical protein